MNLRKPGDDLHDNRCNGFDDPCPACKKAADDEASHQMFLDAEAKDMRLGLNPKKH